MYETGTGLTERLKEENAFGMDRAVQSYKELCDEDCKQGHHLRIMNWWQGIISLLLFLEK